MELQEVFKHFGSLFEVFKYWSIALVAAVVVIMVPINILYKKIMKKDELSRLRKLTAFFSVYLLSLGLISLLTHFAFPETALTFSYLSGATLALGFCSQFTWEIIKLIRDYGFKKVMVLVAENIDWKKALKEFGKQHNVDTKITDIIATEIENKYLKEIETDAIKAFAENRLAIITEVKDKIAGFASNEKVDEVAIGIFNLLKDAWVKPESK